MLYFCAVLYSQCVVMLSAAKLQCDEVPLGGASVSLTLHCSYLKPLLTHTDHPLTHSCCNPLTHSFTTPLNNRSSFLYSELRDLSDLTDPSVSSNQDATLLHVCPNDPDEPLTLSLPPPSSCSRSCSDTDCSTDQSGSDVTVHSFTSPK